MFANEVLICFALPLHLGLHRVYHIFTTLIHQGARPALRLRGIKGKPRSVSTPEAAMFSWRRSDSAVVDIAA